MGWTGRCGAWLLIGCAGLAGCQSLPETGGPGAPFQFVQITDTHLGTDDHFTRVEKIAEQVNQLPMPIAFVAHTGDISMEQLDQPGHGEQIQRTMGRFKAPVYYVAGNHDILQERPDSTRQAYLAHLGPMTQVHEHQGVVLLFWYGEAAARGTPAEGQAALDELERALVQTQGKPVLLFQHTPPVGGLFRNQIQPGWPAETRQRWESLVRTHQVKAVLCGHFHKDELHWLGDIPLFVAPPVAGYYGRQAAYRIYEYRDGHLSYRTLYLR